MQNKLVLNSATEQVLNDRYEGVVKEVCNLKAKYSLNP